MYKAIVQNDTILIDFGDEVRYYGKLADANIIDDQLVITNNGLTKFISLYNTNIDWSEVIAQWNIIYPQGKKPTLSLEDRKANLLKMILEARVEAQSIFTYDGFVQPRSDYDVNRMQQCAFMLQNKFTDVIFWDYKTEKVTKEIRDFNYFTMMIVQGNVHESFLREIEKMVATQVEAATEETIDTFTVDYLKELSENIADSIKHGISLDIIKLNPKITLEELEGKQYHELRAMLFFLQSQPKVVEDPPKTE